MEVKKHRNKVLIFFAGFYIMALIVSVSSAVVLNEEKKTILFLFPIIIVCAIVLLLFRYMIIQITGRYRLVIDSNKLTIKTIYFTREYAEIFVKNKLVIDQLVATEKDSSNPIGMLRFINVFPKYRLLVSSDNLKVELKFNTERDMKAVRKVLEDYVSSI